MIQAALQNTSTPTGAFQAPPNATRKNTNSFLATFTLQLTLGVMLLGMVGALLLSSVQNSGKVMAGVLGAAAAMAFLGLRGVSKLRLPTAVWVLIACITLAGVPGMALDPNGAIDNGLPFLIFLIIRNYVCFFAIPLSLAAKRSLLERSLLKWSLAIVVVIAVGTILAAQRAGVSLQSVSRLTGADNGWINMNTVALFCAYGLLVCAMATFIPRLIRLTLAVPMLYCLTLTQSRTAIIALIISMATHFVISYRRRKAAGIAIAVIAIFLSALFFANVASLVRSVPQLNAITDRFQGKTGHGDDMRAGVIQHGLEVWYQAPIFGHGFNAEDSHFENGYLSLACESGAVGLVLYLGFITFVLLQTRRLMKTPEGSRSYTIGTYLFCTTVFIVVHGMGERSHGFQIGSAVSNIWAMLIALGYVIPLSGQGAARKAIPWYSRADGDEKQVRVPLRHLPGRWRPVR